MPACCGIEVTVLLIDKTPTRHAEAMFVRLNPVATVIEMDKLGSWIELEPGLVVDGGNKHMHGVNSGIRFNRSDGSSLAVETLDAGVVVFGAPVGFPTIGPYGNGEPDLAEGASSMLLNNLWGTNYVMCVCVVSFWFDEGIMSMRALGSRAFVVVFC